MSKRVKARVGGLEEHVICDVCGRTMLKGERSEPYLTPSRERKLVCQLCAPRAQQEGWIRESASPATPVRPPRPQQGRRFLRRGRRRDAVGADDSRLDAESSSPLNEDVPPLDRMPLPAKPLRRFRRDPRHVRAVPTNAQLKIERAVELFNGSEHPRTVAGIARTLGEPKVSAQTAGSSAEVVLTVAWDISWYQFVADLSDGNEPVRMEARGGELGELKPAARDWNAGLREDGSIALPGENDTDADESGPELVAPQDNGEGDEQGLDWATANRSLTTDRTENE